MIGWILLGIVGFIIILFIILKVVNKPDYKVVRVGSDKSFFDKVKDACCTRKR